MIADSSVDAEKGLRWQTLLRSFRGCQSLMPRIALYAFDVLLAGFGATIAL